MEHDEKEKTLVTLEKQNQQKDKIISEMKQQLRDFEEQKLEFIESEEKLCKLYHHGIIDSNREFLGKV